MSVGYNREGEFESPFYTEIAKGLPADLAFEVKILLKCFSVINLNKS